MAGAFLNLRISTCAYAAALLLAGCLFDDPVRELDPALLDDASFDTLPASASYRVARGHILESFGAYNCGNCPGAEARLSPYLHAAPGSAKHVPGLVIVNYHVAFSGALIDPWITSATQQRHDQFGFTGLPQVKLNGGNAPYGIREKTVLYSAGEYDSLLIRIPRVHRADSLTWLDLVVDTARYDSVARSLIVRFTLSNRAVGARGALSLQVVAVKNRAFPYYYLNHVWEVVVAETTNRDSGGVLMTLPAMAGLRSKSWESHLAIPLENERNPAPLPLESPANYGVIVFARNAQGVVQNVATWNYAPEP